LNKFFSRKLLQNMATRNILASDDVSTKNNRLVDRTSRRTDPNNVFYHINGMDLYDDKYTKPKEGKKLISDNHQLQTKDITGAIADTRYADHFPRKEYKNINFIGDIEGAHADSIKHSITTKRTTHPLQPVYQSLDPGELLLPLIPPLIPAEMIKVPTLPQINREPAKSATHLQPNSYSRPKTDNQVDFDQTWGTANGTFVTFVVS
jgi:hypothetical protein